MAQARGDTSTENNPKYIFNLGLASVMRMASILERINQAAIERDSETWVKTLERFYIELRTKMGSERIAEALVLKNQMITDYNNWVEDDDEDKKMNISPDLQRSCSAFEEFLRDILEETGLNAPQKDEGDSIGAA